MRSTSMTSFPVGGFLSASCFADRCGRRPPRPAPQQCALPSDNGVRMKTRVRLALLALFLVTLSAFGASKKDDLDSFFAKYNALKQFNGSALVANRDGVIL